MPAPHVMLHISRVLKPIAARVQLRSRCRFSNLYGIFDMNHESRCLLLLSTNSSPILWECLLEVDQLDLLDSGLASRSCKCRASYGVEPHVECGAKASNPRAKIAIPNHCAQVFRRFVVMNRTGNSVSNPSRAASLAVHDKAPCESVPGQPQSSQPGKASEPKGMTPQ